MKKYFRLAAMAIAVLGLAVACKQKPAEEPIDTTPIDTMPLIEEVIDSVEVVAEEVAEPVVQKATTKKKEEPKKDDGFATRKKVNEEEKGSFVQKAPVTDNSKRTEIDRDKAMQKVDDKTIVKTSKK